MQTQASTKQWLKALAKPARGWVMLSVCLGLLSGLLLIAEMYSLAHIADAVYIHHQLRDLLMRYFFVMLALVAIRGALAYWRSRVGFYASASIRQNLRVKLLEHINQLGPVYAGQLSSAQLVSAAMEQVESLHEFFAFYLPQMSLAVLMPLAILVFVFPLSAISATLLLICAPLLPLFMALVGIGAASLQQKHFQSLARMSTQFLDAIQGLITLKLLGKSKVHAKKLFFSSEVYRVKTMKVLNVAFLSSGVLELFAAGSIALLATYLGLGFINRGMGSHLWHVNLSLQSALFILLLAPEFFLPLRELGTHYHAKAKAIGAAAEIAKVFGLKAPTVMPSPRWPLPKKIAVQFNHVSVTYPNKKTLALKQVNFSIQAGEKIAILGLSGAGKTTIFNSLLKFIAPSAGNVFINGEDLQSINQQDWYRAVSWVGQQTTLFHGDIRENLLLAKPCASDIEIHHALQLAMLDEFVARLPEGINTKIGDHRAGLSGGQAQRLALARAYLKNAPLLLLDEPTASLDAEYEAKIWNSLERYWQDKTVLLLTHRLSHLDKMDRVLKIEEGSLIEVGRPALAPAN